MAEKSEEDNIEKNIDNEEHPLAEVKPLEVSKQNLIDTAVKFLQNSKVRNSPLSQKIAFLKSKGLTPNEIDEAITRSGVPENQLTLSAHSSNGSSTVRSNITHHPGEVRPSWPRFHYVFATTMIVSGALCGLYVFSKKYIFPYLFGFPTEEERLLMLEKKTGELQNNVDKTLMLLQEMLKELQATVQKLNMKQDTLLVAQGTSKSVENQLIDMKSEMASLKGLLLSRNQFPAAPSFASVIPPWQMATKPEVLHITDDDDERRRACPTPPETDIHYPVENEDTPCV